MQMHTVIPSDEFKYPLPCLFDVFEALRRIARAVLASAEPSLDMGVIVRYAGAAMRRRDAQCLQLGLERMRFLRSTVVSMQYQWLVAWALFPPARPFDRKRPACPPIIC